MIIEEDVKLDFKDVLMKPKRSTLPNLSRKNIDLIRRYQFKYSQRHFDGIPIIASNMDTIGTMDMYRALSEFKLATALHKHIRPSELERCLIGAHNDSCPDLVFVSMGIGDSEFNRVKEMYSRGHRVNICIDVANGYSEQFAKFVEKMRQEFPDITIMAGNVVTAGMTQELILSGADIVKVGIGPGSVCTTRKQTGVGYPQLSAIIECADAAHGLGGHVCGDGGCTVPGDIAKAFGAGADFVMLGGMLAGHDECGGELVGGEAKLIRIDNLPEVDEIDSTWTGYDLKTNGKIIKTLIGTSVPLDLRALTKLNGFGVVARSNDPMVIKHPELFTIIDRGKMCFYGMSSKTAMDKYHGGVADYRSSEGKTVLVPYRGQVANTVKDILGGLRSSCTLVGAERLKDLSKCTTFIKVTQQINNIFS